MLDDPGLVERFMEALAGRGQIEQLILLGDVIDLWMKTTVPALKDARAFIDGLSQLTNVKKILYVPGNHDYQMFLDAFRLEVDVKIMQGDLTIPKFMTARSYGDSVLTGLAHPRSKAHFPMTYPFTTVNIGGRDVVFTHGHHLDFYAGDGWGRRFWLGRYIMKKRTSKATLYDIEMANIPFCGAMSVWPWVPELVEEGLRYYHVISFFGKVLHSDSVRESPLRDSLIKENYDEIAQLLPQLGFPRPACFVYGHTHRPGIGRLPGSDTIVVNTGSWTRQEEPEVPSRTWVELDGDVKLMRLGHKGPEMISSEAL
jgi:UDP-2,3-diacylglucosamine pyrophosphatase LpxH